MIGRQGDFLHSPFDVLKLCTASYSAPRSIVIFIPNRSTGMAQPQRLVAGECYFRCFLLSVVIALWLLSGCTCNLTIINRLFPSIMPLSSAGRIAATFHYLHKTSSPLQLRVGCLPSLLIPPARYYLMCLIPPILFRSLCLTNARHLPGKTQHKAPFTHAQDSMTASL